MASSTIRARWAAGAECRPCLKGCSRAGTNHSSSSPSVSTAAWATSRWPWWIGSKEPPRSPIIPSGGFLVRRAYLREALRVRVEPSNITAGLLDVLVITQLVVRLHQVHERPWRRAGAWVGGDHIPVVQDGRVVG